MSKAYIVKFTKSEYGNTTYISLDATCGHEEHSKDIGYIDTPNIERENSISNNFRLTLYSGVDIDIVESIVEEWKSNREVSLEEAPF